ncbi:uncharacterized protein LOC136078741 [Hydra vulgaris]|uniref:Uncharacterized protein LOC136078741 n=1 Tax=Hydra vulgaris TaxID=6087 RepID=A0ABM4BNF2_HYDVU
MSSCYKARKYKDYTNNDLSKCLEEVKCKKLTQKQAAAKYGISRRTICYKLKGKDNLKPGRPYFFSKFEEAAFVKCTIQLSDFGFPIGKEDLRHIMNNYLISLGKKVKEFKIFPGPDLVNSFLQRHPQLTSKFVPNLKKSRAIVNEEILKDYIQELSKTVQNVPPSNIYNYDETNLSDDPGLKKCLVKRGNKYPANIRNTSKTSVSIMISGNAAGEVLPPFVVYKAVNLWSTWCEGGPKGVRYFNIKSGWFDGAAFEECFFSIVLPSLKKKLGVKVLLGVNLSSHISAKVINVCEKNKILFVCLPPNSTHITQLLDVAFFKPLKTAWRRIITEYKDSSAGCTKTSLEKQHFPELLNKLLIAIELIQANNLKSGFRKCGNYPVNVNQLLTQFRERESYNKEFSEDSFKIFLQEKYKPLQSSETKQQKKKLFVPAGKSVGTEDLEKFSNSFDIC